jgi:DNA-binding transcriptional regulator YiaG
VPEGPLRAPDLRHPAHLDPARSDRASDPETNSIYSSIVERIRDHAFSTAEIAEITGVGVRQVLYWSSGEHRPRGATRDRLLELDYIVTRLGETFRPEGVEIWIHARNRTLGGRKPIDLLREGDFVTVLHAIESLDSGAM